VKYGVHSPLMSIFVIWPYLFHFSLVACQTCVGIVTSVKINPPKDLSVSECERIVVALIEAVMIDLDVRWNAYE
jgi:hypothetical protein